MESVDNLRTPPFESVQMSDLLYADGQRDTRYDFTDCLLFEGHALTAYSPVDIQLCTTEARHWSSTGTA